MALTREKKQHVVDEVAALLSESRMTVVAKYEGTTVKQLQELRKQAIESETTVKVIKNRLVVQALNRDERFKDAPKESLREQLIYAFNVADEVAPAQALANFAKKNPTIVFIGAFTADGNFISAEEVKSLASLPSKPQMLAGLINTLNSPVREVLSGVGGGLQGILQGLEAKASNN